MTNFERYFDEDQVIDMLFTLACSLGDMSVACKFCKAYEDCQKENFEGACTDVMKESLDAEYDEVER